jgi:EmrB/QacA subfamily drug resistance transporter
MTTEATISITQDASRQRIAFMLLCLARFMVILDASIVNVALPSIQNDFHFSTQTLQWVVSIYSLTFGGFLLLSGRAGDLFGRQRIFMSGLVIFSLASLAGGLAPSGAWFIVARAVQGIGATLIAPTTLSLITTIFAEGPARNRAFGVVGSISSFGFAAGALLGGLLVAGPGWRWVMFVNVPVGLLALILAPIFLVESKGHTQHQHVDILGALLITTSLISLVYGLAEGNTFGWGSLQTIGLIVLALVILATFVFTEQRSRSPLIRLGIFRLRTLTGGNLTSLFCSAAFVSLLFMLTLYMQRVLNYSAIDTGLAFLPLSLTLVLMANITPRLVPRIGVKRLLVSGMVIFAVGLALFSRVTTGSTFLGTFLPGLIVIAIGLGFSFSPMFIASTAGVSNDEQGLASGLINTTQQVGSSVGLAITTTFATARTTMLLQGGASIGDALGGGFQVTIIICIVFALLAALVSQLVIREHECTSALANLTQAEHHQSMRPFTVHLTNLLRL